VEGRVKTVAVGLEMLGPRFKSSSLNASNFNFKLPSVNIIFSYFPLRSGAQHFHRGQARGWFYGWDRKVAPGRKIGAIVEGSWGSVMEELWEEGCLKIMHERGSILKGDGTKG